MSLHLRSMNASIFGAYDRELQRITTITTIGLMYIY